MTVEAVRINHIHSGRNRFMNGSFRSVNLRQFLVNIILPTLLTIGLFIVLIFSFVIPYFEENMLDGKKEMLRELVDVAMGIASGKHKEAAAGAITDEAAKAGAIAAIEHLRYGMDGKDYFWITDFKPAMIMHPYRPDLNGKDLSDFRDPNGKRLFVEMVNAVKAGGKGYVNYMWQWMDDSLHIVPKISYVQSFKPWNWIIGTGIYIEDVKSEMAAIKRKLSIVSLAISALMALFLFLIVRQNLKGEFRRSRTEEELRISREKYKALVEASTEGTSMFLDGECIFSNRKFEELLGIKQTDRISPDLRELIVPDRSDDMERIRRFNAEGGNFMQMETVVASKDRPSFSALLSISHITLDDKNGFIIVVKELSRDDESAEEKDERGRQLLALSDAFATGIFKCTAGKNARFIDVNDHLVDLLGYRSKEELLKTEVSSLVDNENELKSLLNVLEKQSICRDFAMHVRLRNGLHLVVSVSAVAESDPNGHLLYFFGTMTDISRQKAMEMLRNDMQIEMQAGLLFMNQEIKGWVRDVVSCDMNVPVADAARSMLGHNTDTALIGSSAGEFIGILTASDICRRVIATGKSPERPVYEFMSAPLASIGDREILSEAVLLMKEKGIGRLCVRDAANRILGIVKNEDLVNLQHNTGGVLIAAAERALSPADLKHVFGRLHLYVNSLIEGGARTSVVTKYITAVSDAISSKIARMVIQDLGVPPVPFTFVAFGSEGRGEQTLLTDQDNAIIYADVEDERKEVVQSYFLNFGERMSAILNEVGYRYCIGNIMARNPRWNQPLSEWKRVFSSWITEPEPINLLESAIFFDYRPVFGDAAIIEPLTEHIQELLSHNPAFFGHMAREGLHYKIPLGLFGRIHTESDEEHTDMLNIKNPLRVIVNLVRLYAMKDRLAETNSMKRMQRLYERGIFGFSFYQDLSHSYDYMMVLQLRSQGQAFSRNAEITNYINLQELSSIELNTLKNVLSQLSTFQNKVKYDFGVPE